MKKLFLIMLAAGFIGFTACTSGSKDSAATEETEVVEEAPVEEAPVEEAPVEEAPADSTAVEGEDTDM